MKKSIILYGISLLNFENEILTSTYFIKTDLSFSSNIVHLINSHKIHYFTFEHNLTSFRCITKSKKNYGISFLSDDEMIQSIFNYYGKIGCFMRSRNNNKNLPGPSFYRRIFTMYIFKILQFRSFQHVVDRIFQILGTR